MVRTSLEFRKKLLENSQIPIGCNHTWEMDKDIDVEYLAYLEDKQAVFFAKPTQIQEIDGEIATVYVGKCPECIRSYTFTIWLA